MRGLTMAVVALPGLALATSNTAAPTAALPAQRAPGPILEISGATAPVALPAIPDFAIPVADGGLHTPHELLVAGERLRGSQLRVAGYITWIYDCTAAFARPGLTRAQLVRMVEAHPTRCERSKFYLGDAPDTPPERSLWVVDVPRRPFQLERAHLTGAQLADWPEVPRLRTGAYVEVAGTFALRSPHGEVHSDGLMVYASVDTVDTGDAAWHQPPAPRWTAPPSFALPPVPPIAPLPPPPVPAQAGDSIRHAAAGARAYVTGQYDTAIAEYEAAVRAWSSNHAAWYGLAGARSMRGAYRAAADAAGRAVALVPDQAMYWLLRGQLLHEAALDEARNRAARAQGCRADQAAVDRAAIDVAPALSALLAATRLESRLWRAHYHIGRILRDRGDARGAAAHFTEAIALHAWDAGPYLALSELYRRWGYHDEALAITELAATVVPDVAEVWYELGMIRDDGGDAARAIAAYTRALELAPRLDRARFARGQAYVRRGELASARRDLDAFVQAGGTGFAVDQARRLLADIPR